MNSPVCHIDYHKPPREMRHGVAVEHRLEGPHQTDSIVLSSSEFLLLILRKLHLAAVPTGDELAAGQLPEAPVPQLARGIGFKNRAAWGSNSTRARQQERTSSQVGRVDYAAD